MQIKGQFLTVFIAFAMVINGIFNIAIGFSQIAAFGVLHNLEDLTHYADVVQVHEASSLLTVFLGFWLIFLGIGLIRQNYFAWLWSLIVLIVSFANSLFPPVSLLNALVAMIFVLILYFTRKAFHKNRFFIINYRRLVALLTVMISLAYGVLGSYFFRDQFHGINSAIDSMYFTLVTYSTLGYGDIYPLTANAKIFVCSMIVVGISAFVATLTIVVAPLIQKRMEGVLSIMDKFQFKNHVVIYGYNPLARYLVKSLGIKANLDCLFITRTQSEKEEAEVAGFQAFVGNIHAKEDLSALRAESAKYVVFVSDHDADNILGAMAMAQLNQSKSRSDAKIIVRVEQEINVDKAYHAGADLVISASQLAGNTIADKLLHW